MENTRAGAGGRIESQECGWIKLGWSFFSFSFPLYHSQLQILKKPANREL
jgi:hypothetical protein